MLMDLWYIFTVRSDTLVIQIQLPVLQYLHIQRIPCQPINLQP